MILYVFSLDYEDCFDLDEILVICIFGPFAYLGHLYIWAIGAGSQHRLLEFFQNGGWAVPASRYQLDTGYQRSCYTASRNLVGTKTQVWAIRHY